MSDEPQTINIGPHPDLYNRALRDLGVTSVTVEERADGVQCANTNEGAIGDLINAIAVAHVKLIAAESQISLLTSAKGKLQLVMGMQAGDWSELEDAIENVDSVIANLTAISREP